MLSKSLPIRIKIPVRFSDTDAMGHMNNSRFFSFMEEGRVAYVRKLFPTEKPSDSFSFFPFILADAQCSFKSPVYTGEEIEVALGVTGFGTKSFTMEYLLTEVKTARLVATGKSVMVMYDYKSGQSVSVPQEFREAVTRLQGGQQFP